MFLSILFHPRPASPVKGEASNSLPWREGSREGDDMTFNLASNIIMLLNKFLFS